jgi:hypothetical protein
VLRHLTLVTPRQFSPCKILDHKFGTQSQAVSTIYDISPVYMHMYIFRSITIIAIIISYPRTRGVPRESLTPYHYRPGERTQIYGNPYACLTRGLQSRYRTNATDLTHAFYVGLQPLIKFTSDPEQSRRAIERMAMLSLDVAPVISAAADTRRGNLAK